MQQTSSNYDLRNATLQFDMPFHQLMKLSRLFLACIILFVPMSSYASDSCYWVSSSVQSGNWWIISGKCELTISKQSFVALLYDGKEPKFLRMKVKGTIKNNRIHAVAEVESSDVGQETYDGTLTKGKLYKNVFILSNPYSMIGIKTGPN